ncbi:hypothetical protein ACU4GD_21495 [Cupriavidus basilensis]
MSIIRMSVPASRASSSERVEGEAGGVRALRARYHRRAGALAPDPQLLDAAPEGSPAASMTLCLARNFWVSLLIVVVLPAPLTPIIRITNGFFVASITRVAGHRIEGVLDLRGQDRPHLVGAMPLLVVALADFGLGDPGRGVETEIGLDHVLQLLQGVQLHRACACGGTAR